MCPTVLCTDPLWGIPKGVQKETHLWDTSQRVANHVQVHDILDMWDLPLSMSSAHAQTMPGNGTPNGVHILSLNGPL